VKAPVPKVKAVSPLPELPSASIADRSILSPAEKSVIVSLPDAATVLSDSAV
jgi:hypothetical protein